MSQRLRKVCIIKQDKAYKGGGEGVYFSESIWRTPEQTGIALCPHRQYTFTRDKQFCNRKTDEILFTELQENGVKKSGLNNGWICATSLNC